MDHVSFTDSGGIRWSVWEDGDDETRAHASADGAPGTVWLRFESEYEVRRLWHYPDDWRGLSPLQLESLLERASTVVARFRPVARPRSAPGAEGISSAHGSEPESETPRAPVNSHGFGGDRRPCDSRADDHNDG